MGAVETDYLVVGAGALGMAFVDSLLSESDADVVLVDRRHRPGGHWNDAYPFVRLHQPSAYYGVCSRVLGNDVIDDAGANAGFYERASAAEICDYYQRVLDERLLASGRVRFFGMSEHTVGSEGHRVVSRLTGEATRVRVRRKVVDATYVQTSVPATHTPSFSVEPGAQLTTPNDLVQVAGAASGYTVIGGGKTGMDACAWLLDNGVDPAAIRWIVPRDPWLLDRAYQQPLRLVASLIEGVSLSLEAAAEAESVADLFGRLEACGQLLRLDPEVEPTMYHCATISIAELDSLRRIDKVVRGRRVTHVGTDRIELDTGSIPTDPGQVHVDCTARALALPPLRPIFEGERITLQPLRGCQPPFSAAFAAFAEATRDDDARKNRLCPPTSYPNVPSDWISGTYVVQRTQLAWSAEPDVDAWLEASRLNPARGIRDAIGDRRMKPALTRLFSNLEPALAKLEAFAAQPA